MCFSGEMSAVFGLICFGLGAIVWAGGRPKRLAVSMAYFGLMELLQTVQYMFVAKPEDGYEMCKSPTNQFLTFLGTVHIAFQPFFANMAICSVDRLWDIKIRYQNDIILRLSLLFAVWGLSRYWLAVYWPDNPNLAARPSKDCPNYEWLREGYDAGIGWETPNLPGHSCTFISNTTTRHIAWAVPGYQATYFMPGVSLHFFLMFAPALVVLRHIPLGVIFMLSGPILAAYITPSMSEQASIWCFFSVVQCLAFTCIAFLYTQTEPVVKPEAVHPGGFGEKAMKYELVVPVATKNGTNGHPPPPDGMPLSPAGSELSEDFMDGKKIN